MIILCCSCIYLLFNKAFVFAYDIKEDFLQLETSSYVLQKLVVTLKMHEIIMSLLIILSYINCIDNCEN